MKMFIILAILGICFLLSLSYTVFEFYKPRIKTFCLNKVYRLQGWFEITKKPKINGFLLRRKYEMSAINDYNKQQIDNQVKVIKKRDEQIFSNKREVRTWRVIYKNGGYETICTDLEVIE